MNFHNRTSPFKLIRNESLVRDYPSICVVKLNLNYFNNPNDFNMVHLVRQLVSVLLLCFKSQG